jgi:hypothetical protein
VVEEDDGWEGGVSPAILSGMSEDPDEEKRRNLANKSDEEIEKEKAEILYARYLRQSRETDLSEIARYNLIYPSGSDQQGRPVVVVVGSHFPTKQTPELLGMVLLYVIRVMDHIVNKDYVIVYLHSNMTQDHMPEFSWLRQLHFIFDHKYAKNLRACYVVHPTFWLKAAAVVMSPFMNSNFTDKLRYFNRLQDLLTVVDIQRLNIPSSVFTYALSLAVLCNLCIIGTILMKMAQHGNHHHLLRTITKKLVMKICKLLINCVQCNQCRK